MSCRSVPAQNSIWMYRVVAEGLPVKFDELDMMPSSESSSSEKPSSMLNSCSFGASSRPSIQAW